MVTALEHHLGGAECDRLAAPPQDLLGVVRPALGVLGRAVERTELAGRHADVGVVDVAIDDVRDDAVGVAPAPDRVRGLAQRMQRRVGVEQQRLVGADPPAVGRTLQDVVELPVSTHVPEGTGRRKPEPEIGSRSWLTCASGGSATPVSSYPSSVSAVTTSVVASTVSAPTRWSTRPSTSASICSTPPT